MKSSTKAKTKSGATRDLVAELSEGMEALTDERQGKRTLPTHAMEIEPALEVLAHKPFEEIVEPVAQSFDESGMSEEELDELIIQTRTAVREANRKK